MRIAALAFALLCATAHADNTYVRLNYADHSLVVRDCTITQNDPYVLAGGSCASASVVAPASGLDLHEPNTHIALAGVIDDQCQYVAYTQTYDATGVWLRAWEFQCGDFVFSNGFEQ